MAPMARTSRKDPSLNALDDLDLDGMFEGGQDGLFDELGMDLGDLGDITNDSKLGGPPVPKGLDDMQFDLLGDIGVDDGVTASPVVEPRKKSKRRAKRTPKGSPLDTDDEDEEPLKKKPRRYTKKNNKATTKKSKADKTEADASPPATIKGKSKTKASSGSPAIERGISQGSMVAAAGQFGGRHKRGNYPPLSRSTSKASKSKAAPAATVLSPATTTAKTTTAKASTTKTATAKTATTKISKAAAAAAAATAEPIPPPNTAKRNRSMTELSKPLETLFCGLLPSETIFYPFMPAIPAEPSMKKCNKHYPHLEKLNTSLAATIPGPDSDDALLKLLMFHDPVPTKEKKLLMAASITSARKAAEGMDRQKLVTDLHAVSTLVKRQHDFLAQSLENMQRWCKGSFTGDDYRAVYGGVKPKPVLAQLTSPYVRVRVKCNGFKEPKMATALIAHVPQPGTALKQPTSHSSSATTKKKRESAASSSDKPAAPEAILHYVDLPPNGRRQRITEILTKHAQILEAKQGEMDESRRKTLEKQYQALQKVVDDDDLVAVNTMTLWKWIDKAGYLSDYAEQDIRDLLVYQPVVDEESLLWEESPATTKAKPIQDSLYDRLSSLLVDVEVDDNDDDDSDNDSDDDEENSLGSMFESTNELKGADEALLDISKLSIEQKAYLHLRAAGLVDEGLRPPENKDGREEVEKRADGNRGEEIAEFDSLVWRMKADLLRMDRMNNARTGFIESSAKADLELTKHAKRQDERYSQMLTKFNQILKKQKENKRSARQKLPKKDEDWVPW